MVVAAMPAPLSKGAIWTGRVLTTVVVAFLLFDGIIKFMMIQPVIDTFAQMGYPVPHANIGGWVDFVWMDLQVAHPIMHGRRPLAAH